MSIFGKKVKGETIDFTYLQKRGLLKPPRHTYKVNLPTSSDGVVDFRKLAISQQAQPSEEQNSQAQESSGAFGFLANLAGSAPIEQPQSSTEFPSSGFGTDVGIEQEERIREARRARLAEFNSMKVKIDDLEYKLERSLERIAQLESQIREMKS